MPPKDIHEMPEMYVQTPDGKRLKVGRIQQAQCFSDDYSDFDITDNLTMIRPSKMATFEIIWNPNVETIYVLIHGRLPSNNWRKMHGMGTRRKSSKKKSRRENGRISRSSRCTR